MLFMLLVAPAFSLNIMSKFAKLFNGLGSSGSQEAAGLALPTAAISNTEIVGKNYEENVMNTYGRYPMTIRYSLSLTYLLTHLTTYLLTHLTTYLLTHLKPRCWM
jgi:hypothetical protein